MDVYSCAGTKQPLLIWTTVASLPELALPGGACLDLP